MQSLASKEAKKIVRGSVLAGSENHKYLFYEGGPFELAVASALDREIRDSKIVFNFHNSRYWSRVADNPKLIKALIQIMSTSEKIIFSAESINLATELSSKTGLHVRTFPVYTTMSEQLGVSAEVKVEIPKPKSALVITGDMGMVPSARDIATYLFEQGFENIHLHWSGRDFDSDFAPAMPLRVTQTSGQIDAETYSMQLREASILLLNYPTSRYVNHSSGRIEDALLFQCIPVVPQGTALAFQNGRNFPVWSLSQGSLSVTNLGEYEPGKNTALDTKRALELMFSWAQDIPTIAKTDNWEKLALFPSPLREKSLIDVLSILRLRLGVQDSHVRHLRSLFRNASIKVKPKFSHVDD